MIGNMPKSVAIEMLSNYRQSLLKMIDGLYPDGFMMIDALELAIKALEKDIEVEELRERVDELEALLRDPDRINSSSYYTLGRL